MRAHGGGLPVGLLEVGLPEHVEGDQVLPAPLGPLCKGDVVVVGIEPLHKHPVDVREGLGVEQRVQVAPDLERERNRGALEALRRHNPGAEPARGIGVVPRLQGVPAGIVEHRGRSAIDVASVHPPARDLTAVSHHGSPKLFDALLKSWNDVPEVGDHGSSRVRGVRNDRQQGWAMHPVGSRASGGEQRV